MGDHSGFSRLLTYLCWWWSYVRHMVPLFVHCALAPYLWMTSIGSHVWVVTLFSRRCCCMMMMCPWSTLVFWMALSLKWTPSPSHSALAQTLDHNHAWMLNWQPSMCRRVDCLLARILDKRLCLIRLLVVFWHGCLLYCWIFSIGWPTTIFPSSSSNFGSYPINYVCQWSFQLTACQWYPFLQVPLLLRHYIFSSMFYKSLVTLGSPRRWHAHLSILLMCKFLCHYILKYHEHGWMVYSLYAPCSLGFIPLMLFEHKHVPYFIRLALPMQFDHMRTPLLL